jgi:hypothetical protein
MNYRISVENDFLRADLLDRETADETRRFLQSVVLATVNHRCSRVLVHVRLSTPMFTVERHGVLSILKKIAADPTHKIALLGDTLELGMSHDYVSLLGRQQGITLRGRNVSNRNRPSRHCWNGAWRTPQNPRSDAPGYKLGHRSKPRNYLSTLPPLIR